MLRVMKFLLKFLVEIDERLDQIQQKLETAMATLQSFKDLLAAVDVETNRIAAKIDEFVAKEKAGDMSAAEETQALDGLTAVADRLRTIGANPTDPVPPVPPEPPVA